MTSPLVLLASVLAGAQALPPVVPDEARERVLQEVMTLIERAEIRHDAGDLDRAATRVSEALSSPSAEAAYARARLVFAQSELSRATAAAEADAQLDEAIEHAEAAISIKPDWGPAHAVLADLLGRKINVTGLLAGLRYGPRAGDAIARAERLAPSSVEVLLAVGRQRLHAPGLFGGSVDEAIVAFRRAVRLDSSRPVARFWLGRALEESGNSAEAAAEYRKAIELEPAYVDARRRLERLEATRRPGLALYHDRDSLTPT